MDATAPRLHGYTAGQGADTATPTPDWVMLRTRLPSPYVGSSITPTAISNHYVLKISVFSCIEMLTALIILQFCLTASVIFLMGALGNLLDQLVDQYDCLHGLIRSVSGLLPSHNDDLDRTWPLF